MKAFFLSLLLLGVLAGIEVRSHISVAGVEFAEDAAYLDQAVARTLASDQLYGIGAAAPIPALRDTLWRSMLAVGSAMSIQSGPFAAALSGLCILAALAVSLALAGYLHPPSVLASGFLVAAAAGWPRVIMTGTSSALAALLVIAGLVVFARGFRPQDRPLPASAALLIGLACTLRIEFSVVWIVLWLYAVVVALLRGDAKGSLVALVRGLNGAVLIALVVAPIFAWNMKTLGVPWPRLPMDPRMLSTPVGADPHSFSAAVSMAWSQLHSSTCLRWIAFRSAFWLGLAALAVDAARVRFTGVQLLPLVLYGLTPVLFGALTPFLGWGAAPGIFRAMEAVWLMTMARGCAALGEGLVLAARKVRGDLPVWISVAGASRVVSLLFFLLALELSRGTRGADTLGQVVAARGALTEAHARELIGGRIAVTDQPGWLAAQGWFDDLIDLTGETTVPVLALVRADGRLDREGIVGLARSADVLMLWGNGQDDLKSGLPSEPIEMGAETTGFPYLARIGNSR